jgi:hypothetical protein
MRLPVPSKSSSLPPVIPRPMRVSDVPYIGAPELGASFEMTSGPGIDVPQFVARERCENNDRVCIEGR